MSIEFKTDAVPENLNVKENPLAGVVKAIVGSGMATDPKTGKLKSKESRSAVLPYKTDEDKAKVETVIRQAQNAGRDQGVTVKKLVTEDGKGKATLTLWAVERVVRKEAEQAPEETAE